MSKKWPKRPVSKIQGLYAILDAQVLGARDPVRLARSLIRAGVRVIQYRGKGCSDRAMWDVCRRLAQLCRREKAVFIVNDRSDIAWAAGADGVHLGDGDLPVAAARKVLGRKMIIGASSHSVREALEVAAVKPDYVALGPIFESRTKITNRCLLGTDAIRKVAGKIRPPLVVIGGIDRHNVAKAVEAGANAVAVIGAVLKARHPGRAAKTLIQEMNGAGDRLRR